MSNILEELQKKIERKKSIKKSIPKHERPQLLELFLMRERVLPLLIRGAIGLIDRQMELNHLAKASPKKPLSPKDDYAV